MDFYDSSLNTTTGVTYTCESSLLDTGANWMIFKSKVFFTKLIPSTGDIRLTEGNASHEETG